MTDNPYPSARPTLPARARPAWALAASEAPPAPSPAPTRDALLYLGVAACVLALLGFFLTR